MRRLFVLLLIPLLAAFPRAADPVADLAADLAKLSPRAIDPDSETGKAIPKMLSSDAKSRLQAAAERENAEWAKVTDRATWEKFRDQRLAALRAALGEPAGATDKLRTRVTGKHEVEGVIVENVVYESRPGLVVTANLYRPAKATKGMPGILLSHSHHSPRFQSELQDMGVTWASAGCVVLVPDHLGHGERRQHPFNTEKDYDRPYKTGRQDYYFRHNSGSQLHLIGDSLMGWFVRDLSRGVDVLLAQQGIDSEKIVLLGAVAGGGDPAGVTAALDPRIKVVVPFNFGGVQPDYTTPANPDRDFYWFGLPYWESTRCLKGGAAEGFAHWMIVGSVAPRGLIYSHEFAWDRERDPAYARIEKVFGFYKAGDKLASAQGQGSLKGQAPESSHCNNIGPLHRSRVYPGLEKMLDMPVPKEVSKRLTTDELRALTPEVVKELGAKPLHEVAQALVDERVKAADARRDRLPKAEQLPALRADLTRVLGDSTPSPTKAPALKATTHAQAKTFVLEPEPGIFVPCVLLQPTGQLVEKMPVVVGIAQQGKGAFLKERSKEIATLLQVGSAVCLIDVRGTGETQSAAGGRRHSSSATSFAHMETLLGRSLLGARLRDLRTGLAALRQIDSIDPKRIALWGESFAEVNPASRKLAIPLEVDPYPPLAEPLGQLLVLLAGIYEPDLVAFHARGGLHEFNDLLDSPFLYVPYDALPPGIAATVEIRDLVEALAPRLVRMTALVDGLNRRVGDDPPEVPVEQWLLTRVLRK